MTSVDLPTTQWVEATTMQPNNDAHYDCYCLKCHAPAEEAAEACVCCRTSFLGCGAFDKLRGARPSSLFRSLFEPTPARAVTGRAA